MYINTIVFQSVLVLLEPAFLFIKFSIVNNVEFLFRFDGESEIWSSSPLSSFFVTNDIASSCNQKNRLLPDANSSHNVKQYFMQFKLPR